LGSLIDQIQREIANQQGNSPWASTAGRWC